MPQSNNMKVLVSFSGGKDSQAALIWAAKEFGAEKIEAVFCDTGWEHECTYDHVNSVCESMGVKLVVLKSSKYDGFVDLAQKKGRFPSSQARFCTEELKIKPMIDYILLHSENLLIVQGIRKNESASRSKMMEMCRMFKYYFEPYGIDGNGKPKYFTYRKKDVVEFVAKYSDDIIRPVFNWTAQDVIDYILENDQKPNPLYYHGFSRVGCFPCIMVRHNEVKQINSTFPEYIERLVVAELNLGRTFFAPDDLPIRFRTGYDPKSGKKLTTAKDMVAYVSGDENQSSLMDAIDDGVDRRCMSFYGLCE
jgi:3'-phosphoadenosine 5'-phosphosulfate sulfotransferase (PAPS reductase)/FAD synthetase